MKTESVIIEGHGFNKTVLGKLSYSEFVKWFKNRELTLDVNQVAKKLGIKVPKKNSEGGN